MASKKRFLDEFDDTTDVNPSKSAKLHCLISSVSSMKSSSSGNSIYFDGAITDGKTNLRLVGFNEKQQKELVEFQSKNVPVAIVNCEIKPNKWGSEMEVIMNKYTDVVKSPSKFDFVPVPQDQQVCDEVTLDKLQDLNNYQRVTVSVKVVSETAVIELQNGLTKQEYVVGDTTATGTVTVWEKSTGILKVGSSYKISGVMVRIYNGKKYLSIPKEKCTISEIDDIGYGAVKEEQELVVHNYNMKNAQIIGVLSFEKYSSCIKCKAKVSLESNIGQCSRCNMKQRLDRCKEEVTARLLVQAGETMKTLTAFTPVLQEICQGSDVAEDALLYADKFDLYHSETNVIIKITHDIVS